MTQAEPTAILSMSNAPKTETLRSSPYNDTQSVGIEHLVGALVKAQKAIKGVEKNRTVTVSARSGSNYTFKYTTFDHIIEHVREPLTANGLWFTQIMKQSFDGAYLLETRLLHESGQWLASQTPIIVDGSAGNQQFGSSLTYMKRYALASILGIASEDDDDANAADGNTVNSVVDRGRKPNAPKPDVISTNTVATDDAGGEALTPCPLPIGMLADGKTPDWTTWGKELMAAIRSSKTINEINSWEAANEPNLKKMTDDAPKLYANLSMALLNAKSKMEKGK